MAAKWRQTLAAVLRATADALDGGNTAQAAAIESRAGPTVLGLTALVQLVAPVVRIVEGRGNLADDARLANTVMDAVALVFPKTAPAIATIELAEAAFLWLAGAVKSGAIRVEPGMPTGWRPGGGPGLRRGQV